MKRLLTVTLALLVYASFAHADHIGIYSDASGTSCAIAPGFTSTTAVIHKFTLGATASRWHIDTSSFSGTVLAFNSPYTTVGSYTNDLSVTYGACVSTSTVLGTMLINATAGVLVIKPAQGYANIIVTDCSLGEHATTGGTGYVTTLLNPCGEVDASQPSTWGSVKALYR